MKYRSSPLATALCIPTFTGDNLSENVEKFLSTMRSVARIEGWGPETIYEILVLKTEGSANYFVLHMSTMTRASMDSIEAAFRQRFKRKWSLESLEKELVSMRQRSQSIEQYHRRLMDLKTRLIETTPVPADLTAAQVESMLDGRLLRAFVTGMRGPIMTRVRAHRPVSIEIAKDYAVFEEESENLVNHREGPLRPSLPSDYL